jgi:hypothetical protein
MSPQKFFDLNVSAMLLFAFSIFILFLMVLLEIQLGNGCRHVGLLLPLLILLDQCYKTRATRKISPIISAITSREQGREGGMMVAVTNFTSNYCNNKKDKKILHQFRLLLAIKKIL